MFPFGREAPEGKINRAGRENCQSIVHGQLSGGLILHHQLLKPLNGIQMVNGIIEVQVSEVLQSGLMGLCGFNLKEKLKCSNGIHEAKN